MSDQTDCRRHSLICHPDTPARTVRSVAVEITLSFDDGFALRYVVEGAVGDIVLPPGDGQLVIADSATDGLWQGTCFEAFLTEEGQPDYTEFNYAPDGRWACYQFDDYRSLLRPDELAPWEMVAERERHALCAARRTGDFPRHRIEARAVRGHRRTRRHQKLLGARAPARQTRFSSSRLLCAHACGTGRGMTMTFGIDRLLADPALRKPLEGQRVALLAHPASVTADLTHSLDALVAAGVNVTAVFGPQHGVRGDLQDNMMESPDFTDPVHGVPCFSLYGEVRRPTGQSMHTFDVVLIDLQDLGCRIYTYVTTLLYMLEAAAQHGKAVWVLDRPNPAGRPVEGTLLRPGWESFVGAAPMVDAPRADDGRDGALVHPPLRPRRRLPRDRNGGLEPG